MGVGMSGFYGDDCPVCEQADPGPTGDFGPGKPVLVERPLQLLSLVRFFKAVEAKLQKAAGDKGYKAEGHADGSALYDFVSRHVATGADAHALGEIIYKTTEAAARPELKANLMVKVAAWAFLVWDAVARREQP